MNKIIIGIDNGTSGSIGILEENEKARFYQIPKREEQDYTKKKKFITRLDGEIFKELLSLKGYIFSVVMERPLVNPKMFKATETALRCFEAELVIIEDLKLPHCFIDSKEWQRKILPQGLKGSKELKKASQDVGLRLFPYLENEIRKQKDADGLLIAYYYQKYLF